MKVRYLLKYWEMCGKMYPTDLKFLNIFDKLLLAEYWGVKCNIFNMTQELTKEIKARHECFIQNEIMIKQLCEKYDLKDIEQELIGNYRKIYKKHRRINQ